jgi:hypothetical protein
MALSLNGRRTANTLFREIKSGLRDNIFFSEQAHRYKHGRGLAELTVGLALCATTQIEQEEDSVRVP